MFYRLFPINSNEFNRIIPLFLIMFLLSFNQSTLWNMKDSLVVTASGAEVIPFIKVWAILPSAVLMTCLFAFLSNRFSQEKVFYILTSGFLCFYALFAFVIYPNHESWHLDVTFELPVGFKGLISMFHHWTFTCFYVACELWNTIVISVMFWRFVNEITHISEASRFYGVLSVAYNVAIIFAGLAAMLAGHISASWENNMQILVGVVIVSGILSMAVFRTMNHQERNSKESSPKLSLGDSLREVGRSPYLACIAIMVVGYSVAMNLIEVLWKDQLSKLYPMAIEYNQYMNVLQIFQGLFAIILSLGLAEMIKRAGWKTAALVTPVLMFVFGALFFGFSQSYLAIAVFFGSVQNCLSKASKYSIFDATKEMALVPLDLESKLKGKTAIDGVGVRLGKSGGAVIHQGLLIVFGSLLAIMPFVGAILLVVFAFWIMSVRQLDFFLTQMNTDIRNDIHR